MAAPVQVEESRTYPVAVEDAFDRLLPLPLTELFSGWYGPLPPIRSTQILSTEQDGSDAPWGTVGQTRLIRLADGGTMRERLVSVERPHRFGYELTGFTGALKPLVDRVDGSWTVAPVGTGARVTWAWDLHPHGRAGELLVPVLARVWPGYARGALARLERLYLA